MTRMRDHMEQLLKGEAPRPEVATFLGLNLARSSLLWSASPLDQRRYTAAPRKIAKPPRLVALRAYPAIPKANLTYSLP